MARRTRSGLTARDRFLSRIGLQISEPRVDTLPLSTQSYTNPLRNFGPIRTEPLPPSSPYTTPIGGIARPITDRRRADYTEPEEDYVEGEYYYDSQGIRHEIPKTEIGDEYLANREREIKEENYQAYLRHVAEREQEYANIKTSLQDLTNEQLWDYIDALNEQRGDPEDIVEATLEMRRRTVHPDTGVVYREINDFFWEMQRHLAEQLADEYLEDIPLSDISKNSIRERAVQWVLQNAVILYREGESVFEDTNFYSVIESLTQDYMIIEGVEW